MKKKVFIHFRSLENVITLFQVRNAQRANYSAVIVYNLNSDKIIPMGGDDSTLIPSVFIGYPDKFFF